MDTKALSSSENETDVSGSLNCSYCKKTFETKRELVHHKYNHQTNSKYACPVCSKVFTSHEGLSRHSRVHQKGKKPVKCKLCKESFTMKLDLEEHHRDCHLEQKAFRCKVCGAEFSWEENLQKHQRMHMVDNYKCQYCDRVFCDTISLKIHQRHHKPVTKPPSPDFKPFSCSICSMRFQFDFSYKAHMNCHKVQGVDPSDTGEKKDEVLTDSTIDNTNKMLIAEFDMPEMTKNSQEVSLEICENPEGSQGVTVRLKPEVEDDIFDQNAHMNRIPADKVSFKVHNAMPYRSANKEISSYIRNSFVSSNNDAKKIKDVGHEPNNILQSVQEECTNKSEDLKTTINGKKRKAYNGRYGELSMTEAKAYQCGFCKKSFRWEVSLKVHVDQHKSGGLKAGESEKANRKVKKAMKVFQKKNSPLKSQLVKRRAGSDDEDDDYTEANITQSANRRCTGSASQSHKQTIDKEPISTVVHLKKTSDTPDRENVTYVKNSSDIMCITPIHRTTKVFEGASIGDTIGSSINTDDHVENPSDETVRITNVTTKRGKGQKEHTKVGSSSLEVMSPPGRTGRTRRSGRSTRSGRYTQAMAEVNDESDTTEDTQLFISIEPEQEERAPSHTSNSPELYTESEPGSLEDNTVLYVDSLHAEKNATLYMDSSVSEKNGLNSSTDKSEIEQRVLHLQDQVTCGDLSKLPTSSFGTDFIKLDNTDSLISLSSGGLVSGSQAFLDQGVLSVQPRMPNPSNVANIIVSSYSLNEETNLPIMSNVQLPVKPVTNHNRTLNEDKNVPSQSTPKLEETSFSFQPITSISRLPEPPTQCTPTTPKMSHLEKMLMSGTPLTSIDSVSTLPGPESGARHQLVYSSMNMHCVPQSSTVTNRAESTDMSCLIHNKQDHLMTYGLAGNGGNVANTGCLQNAIPPQPNPGSLLHYIQNDSPQLFQGMTQFMNNTSVPQHSSQPAQYDSSMNNASFTTESSIVNQTLSQVINSGVMTEVKQSYSKDPGSRPPVLAQPHNCSGDGIQYLQSLQTSAQSATSQYLSHDSHTNPFSRIPNVQAIQKMVQSLPAVHPERSLTQNAKSVRKEKLEQTTGHITQNILTQQGQLVMPNQNVSHLTQVSQPNGMLGSNLVSSDSQNIIQNMQVGLHSTNILSTIPHQNTPSTLQSVLQSQMLANIPSELGGASGSQLLGTTVVNLGISSQDVEVTAAPAGSQILENSRILQHPTAINTQPQLTAHSTVKTAPPNVPGRTMLLNNIQTMHNILPNTIATNFQQEKSRPAVNNTEQQLSSVQVLNKNIETSQQESVINTNLSNVAFIQNNVQVPQNSVIYPALQNNVQYVQPAIQQGMMPVQAPLQTVGLANQPEIRILGNVPNILGTVHLQTGYVPQQVSCINEFGQVLAVTPLFQIPVDQNNLHQSVGGTFIQQTAGPLVQGLSGHPQILPPPVLGQQMVQNVPVTNSLTSWQVSAGNVSQQCLPPNVVSVVAGSGITTSVQQSVSQVTAMSEIRSNLNQIHMSQDTLSSSQQLVASNAMSAVCSTVNSSPAKLSQLDGCYEKETIYPAQDGFISKTKSIHYCFMCDKVLTSPTDYKIHLRLYHGKKNMTTCLKCRKHFKKGLSWVLHKCKMIHKQCGQCSKIIRNIYELRNHKYNHGKVRKGIQCKVCRQKFLGMKGLATHMISHWAVSYS